MTRRDRAPSFRPEGPGAIVPLCIAMSMAGGCAPTETGNPPLTPTVDVATVRHEFTGVRGDSVTFRGAPGTVTPTGGVIDAINLSQGEAAQGTVSDDGSFSVEVLGTVADVFRLQVVSADGRRSEPLDVGVASGAVAAIAHAIGECLALAPGDQLALPAGGAATATIALTNDCPASLSLGIPVLVLAGGGWAITPAGSLELPAGETWSVGVERLADAPMRDVLFVPIAAPDADYRAVTLFVGSTE